MAIKTPKIVTLPPLGLFLGRKSQAVFIRKHGDEENLKTIQSITREITSSTSIQELLFLVEGYRRYHAAENQFLDNFVESLNIETEDPIESPFTASVADSASIEKLFAALSILVMDYLDFIADKHIEEMNNGQLEAFFDLSVHAAAKAFEVSPRILKREFQKLKWHDEEKLGEQLMILASKRKQLINESNNQSKTKLAKILGENEQPNLFIMSGIEHAPVFTQEKII